MLTPVGGFFGSGKTALIAAAGQRLMQAGQRIGVVVGDPGPHAIDPRTLADAGLRVATIAEDSLARRPAEVLAAVEKLAGEGATEVFVEIPGHEFDLPTRGTGFQPVSRRDRLEACPTVATLAIAVDPARALEALVGGDAANFPPEVYALYLRQLAEAELLLMNKADATDPTTRQRLATLLATRYPSTPRIEVSATTGEGIDSWLRGTDRAPLPPVSSDDDPLLARGAAALAWFGTSLEVESAGATDWAAWAADWLLRLQNEVGGMETEIAHAAIRLTAGTEHLTAHLVANDAHPIVAGHCDAAHRRVQLTVNARVHLPPHLLRQVVERTLVPLSRNGRGEP